MYVGCAGGPLFDNKYILSSSQPHIHVKESEQFFSAWNQQLVNYYPIVDILWTDILPPSQCFSVTWPVWSANHLSRHPVNLQHQRLQISSTLQHIRTTFSNLRSSEACTDVLTVRMCKWRLRLKVCAIMKLKTSALATIAVAETATWTPRQDCCGDQDEEERDDHDGSPENDIHLPLPRPCGGRQPPFPRPI